MSRDLRASDDAEVTLHAMTASEQRCPECGSTSVWAFDSWLGKWPAEGGTPEPDEYQGRSYGCSQGHCWKPEPEISVGAIRPGCRVRIEGWPGFEEGEVVEVFRYADPVQDVASVRVAGGALFRFPMSALRLLDEPPTA